MSETCFRSFTVDANDQTVTYEDYYELIVEDGDAEEVITIEDSESEDAEDVNANQVSHRSKICAKINQFVSSFT